MRILVTGVAGFIASHLAERLSLMNHEVVGIDNFSDYYPIDLKRINQRDLEGNGVQVFESDLRNWDDLQKLPNNFDCIFHLAAQPGISSTVTFDDYLSNNVMGTQNLLNFALASHGLKLFVNIATSSVYGVYATKPETAAPEPVSWYGVTKLAAEQLVMTQSRLGMLNACSLRLYSVYGPRERPDKLFTRLIESALTDKPFPLYKGSEGHLRSFTFVGDIVDGMVNVLENPEKVNKQIFNIGSEEERSTREGIDFIQDIIGKEIPIKPMPARSGDQLRTCADITLARKLLNYYPATSLRDGLIKQVEWYKEKFC